MSDNNNPNKSSPELLQKEDAEKNVKWKSFSAWVNGDVYLKPEKKKVKKEPVEVSPQPPRRTAEEVFKKAYKPFAVILISAFIVLMLVVCAYTPKFGVEDAPSNNEVAEKYIEDGLEDTGATNIVSGMILDYRAFDTLGESSVLFTAVMSVMILLRKDKGERKYKSDIEEEQAYVEEQKESKRTPDSILRLGSKIVAPFIIMFGIYVILNGHISPGGGFSGGAIIGAGFILVSVGVGPEATKKFFNFKVFTAITSCSLLAYATLKTYSFYTGSHHMETGVPLGIPGAILSSGFILPLNIFVGMIVACTMFGFYSLFTKGEI